MLFLLLPRWHFRGFFVIRTRISTEHPKDILSIETLLPLRTKSSQEILTDSASLDMSFTTVWSQRTESSLVPRTHADLCHRINMSIQTFFDVLAISVLVEEPAYAQHMTQLGDTFWHLTDIVFVEKFTDIAFLAQAYGLAMQCSDQNTLKPMFTHHAALTSQTTVAIDMLVRLSKAKIRLEPWIKRKRNICWRLQRCCHHRFTDHRQLAAHKIKCPDCTVFRAKLLGQIYD